jgi:hypothetical protein
MAKKVGIPTWLIIVIVIGLVLFTPLGARIKEMISDITAGEIVAPTEEEYYYGVMQIKITESNYFDGGSETTTNPTYTAYHGSLGPGVGGVAIAASGTDFALDKADEGWIYMRIHPGDVHYIFSVDALKASNPRIKEAYWQDVDQDGTDDLICKIWVGDIGERGQALKPVLVIALPLVDEDVAVAVDSPADITAIGTAETVKQITWKLSGVDEKAGFIIGRLYFTTNATREGDDIKLEALSISGLGLDVSLNAPVHTESGNYEAWYLKPADYTELHYGWFAYRGINKADAAYVTVNVRCTLEAGDVISVTLNMEILDSYGNVAATLTDEVVLSA